MVALEPALGQAGPAGEGVQLLQGAVAGEVRPLPAVRGPPRRIDQHGHEVTVERRPVPDARGAPSTARAPGRTCGRPFAGRAAGMPPFPSGRRLRVLPGTGGAVWFEVDTGEMGRARGAVGACAAQVAADVDELGRHLAELGATWQGEAAGAFAAVMARWQAVHEQVRAALTEVGARTRGDGPGLRRGGGVGPPDVRGLTLRLVVRGRSAGRADARNRWGYSPRRRTVDPRA